MQYLDAISKTTEWSLFALFHGPDIPGSYAYYSLQHQTFFLSPVTSTTGYCFCFGAIPSFFLELFLHWSAVAYWAPTDMGSSPFNVLSFCLFILFTGFSVQEYWSGFPFFSPVDHVLSELPTMTHLSWVALHGMAHRFIELDKAVVSRWWYSESVLNNLLIGCGLWGEEERNQTWLQGSGKDEVWKVYWSVKGFGRSMLESRLRVGGHLRSALQF